MRRVICPGCRTAMKVRPIASDSQLRCPQCGQKILLRAAATTHSTATTEPANPFAGLPDFASVAVPPVSGQGRSHPSHPAYAGPARKPLASPRRQHTGPPQSSLRPLPHSGSRPGGHQDAWKKVLWIVCAGGGTLMLLGAGLVMLATSGMLKPRHSGWETASFHGVRVKLPAGGDQTKRAKTMIGISTDEILGRRKESGSQYSLLVTRLNSAYAQAADLDTLVERMNMSLSDKRPVERNGVRGLQGTVVSGSVPGGTEMEFFLKNNRLVVATYSPYSKIKEKIGGSMMPRVNERELDKPSEFFESLQIL